MSPRLHPLYLVLSYLVTLIDLLAYGTMISGPWRV